MSFHSNDVCILTFDFYINSILFLCVCFSSSMQQLLSHGEFLNRIQRSLYYGHGKETQISIPLSDYIADTFSETHRGYSLNRLNYATIGNLRTTPCPLILAMIYLERLKDADPAYTKHVTPTELFLVSMVSSTCHHSFSRFI